MLRILIKTFVENISQKESIMTQSQFLGEAKMKKRETNVYKNPVKKDLEDLHIKFKDLSSVNFALNYMDQKRALIIM